MSKVPVPPAQPSAVAAVSDVPLPDSYEAALQELEGLLRSMESAELPLDQLLGSYQRGAQLLEFCRSRLQAVESQIQVLEAGVLKAWQAQ